MRFYDVSEYISDLNITFPSVTTIIMAANQQGLLGDVVYLRNAEKAAAEGDRIHEAIERINLGITIPSGIWDGLSEPVRNGIRAYIRWQKATGFHVKQTELAVYSLKHGYAGRLDARGYIKHKAGLRDWKSAIYLREDMAMIQIAAYWNAYLEMYPRRKMENIGIVHLGKRDGTFRDIVLTPEQIHESFDKFLTLKQMTGII